MSNQIAYFGTSHIGSGHHFMAINGEFSDEEILNIEKLDGLIEDIFGSPVEAKFFKYLNYFGLAINVSPDDDRPGSKTIVLLKDGKSEDEILKVIEKYPFLKKQFDRIDEKYDLKRTILAIP